MVHNTVAQREFC